MSKSKIPNILAIDTSRDPTTPTASLGASETAPLILAIDTSCDETAVAVTQGATILSNVIWSQAREHAKFGGVMPSLAQRMHEERIDWVVKKAIQDSRYKIQDIEAVAVTAGPGLAIALEVGIRKAKEMAKELKIPLIPVNHVEGHLLSPLAFPRTTPHPPPILGGGIKEGGISFPAFGLVVSGGHTELILIKKIGKYEILAQTTDDALGEALDKAARMLGLGYPGGAILEKMARSGKPKSYSLPLPMARHQDKSAFSYSGLKTAFYRLISAQGPVLCAQQVYDLAASFQDRAFEHLVRVCSRTIHDSQFTIHDLLLGGGVGANTELRKRLRKMCRELGLNLRVPYSAKLYGDNAGMIGVAAGFKILGARYQMPDLKKIDRVPRWKINEIYDL